LANVRNSNTFWVDATGALAGLGDNTKLFGIILVATGATAVMRLEDNQSSTVDKIEVRLATSGESMHFDFSTVPLLFPKGINVTIVTNCTATLILRETQG